MKKRPHERVHGVTGGRVKQGGPAEAVCPSSRLARAPPWGHALVCQARRVSHEIGCHPLAPRRRTKPYRSAAHWQRPPRAAARLDRGPHGGRRLERRRRPRSSNSLGRSRRSSSLGRRRRSSSLGRCRCRRRSLGSSRRSNKRSIRHSSGLHHHRHQRRQQGVAAQRFRRGKRAAVPRQQRSHDQAEVGQPGRKKGVDASGVEETKALRARAWKGRE